MSNKKITLDLSEYEKMQNDIEKHKRLIHKLETEKLVKVKTIYFYSLYRDLEFCRDYNDFTISKYSISEEQLEKDLTESEINNIKEINKANKLIEKQKRFESQLKQIKQLDFAGRLSFLFTGVIELIDE